MCQSIIGCPEYREQTDKYGITPLYMAAFNARVECVKLLLDASRPEYREMVDKNGMTPLHAAADKGYVECVKVLLDGSNPEYREITGKNGVTPLYVAARVGHAECLRILLDGSRPEYRAMAAKYGMTPLFCAAHRGHIECVKLLLDGSCPEYREITQNNGMTPLHACASNGHVDCLKVLLDGSRPEYRDMTDSNDLTALDIARMGEHKECIDALGGAAKSKSRIGRRRKRKSGKSSMNAELLSNLINAMNQIKDMKYEEGIKTIISSIRTCPPKVKSELLEATNPILEEHVKNCFNTLKSGKCETTLALADVGLWLFDTHEEKFVFHLIKAKVNRRMRDFDFAHQDCLNCLSLNKNCADAHFEIGMNYMLEEEMKEAEKAFKRCLKINKGHQHAINALKKIRSK